MRKKLFTFLLALTASIGMMWAETVVVINKSEFTSSGVTKEGVTLALSNGSMTSSDIVAMDGSFEFSTSLGKFTGITIETDANIMQIYEGAYTSAGWPTGQNLGTSAVWTGESETVLISCMVAGMNTITITCTIEEPALATENSITINESSHGSVVASSSSAAAGETITLTATPDDGYQLKSISGVYETQATSSETLNATSATVNGNKFQAQATSYNLYGWRVYNPGTANTLTISSKDGATLIEKIEFTSTWGNGRTNDMLSVSAGTLSFDGSDPSTTVTINDINATSVTISGSGNNAAKTWCISSVKVYYEGTEEVELEISDTENANVKTFTMVDSEVTISAEFEPAPVVLADCGLGWLNVPEGGVVGTIGHEDEIVLPQVNASLDFILAFQAHTATLRLGSTDESVLAVYGFNNFAVNGVGECDVYVVHDEDAVFAYDSAAFHVTVNPEPAPQPAEDVNITPNVDPENPTVYYSTFYDSANKYALPAGVEAYVADLSGANLLLTKIAEAGEVIPANVAVILKSTVTPFTLTVSDADAVTFTATNDLQGSDTQIATPANCYVLAGTDGVVGFYHYTASQLNAHKAYVVYSGSNQAPRRMPFVFDQATGVENIQGDNVQSTKMMENGVLYIIKNGVKYNAQGQIVK